MSPKPSVSIVLPALLLFSLCLCPPPAAAAPGDVDGVGGITLKDVLISLQTAAGQAPTDLANPGADPGEADVNGDLRIGVSEAIYALMAMASAGNSAPATGNEEFTVEDGEAADPLNAHRTETPASNLLPRSVDHSARLPAVKSQGQTGSCTAWSTGYYYKSYHEVVEEGWSADANAFSPMYLFAMQCKNYDKPYHMINAWEVLNRHGCARLSTVPFEDFGTSGTADEKKKYADFNIPGAAHAEAKEFRSGEMNQLSNLNEVKLALTEGPVILGINRYDMMPGNWNPSPEDNYLTYNPANTNYGHAILCVGYDDNKFGVGALKFVNSWGENWAMGGYSWIKYEDYGATDEEGIAMFAMTIKDIGNTGGRTVEGRPAPPTEVTATDAEGPYVDVKWKKSADANYYRVFRARVDDLSTYAEIGTSNNNSLRDYPRPSVKYYYSVVSYNDIGGSTHLSTDTESKDYVDIGSAKGDPMETPRIAWMSNDSEAVSSAFKVSSLDPAAQAMQVFVAIASNGPWHSFGWVGLKDFSITWGRDSEYVGKKPFVRVMVTDANGYSENSAPIQVGEPIAAVVPVAAIQTVSAQWNGNMEETSIVVSWTTDDGPVDFFEIWRYRAASDDANEWMTIGYTEAEAALNSHNYTDAAAQPGVSYYYAVFAVSEGAYSESKVTAEPARVPVSTANLNLYDVKYPSGYLVNPAEFEITVWNDGAETIEDYAIVILAYDLNEPENGSYKLYTIVPNFMASEVAADGQLPLAVGHEHTLIISRDIISAYADGHHYSWVIRIDPENQIEETHEDDNNIETANYWWSEDLTPQKPNLWLAMATYYSGPIRNPVKFELTIQNNGLVALDDYTFSINAYDWDTGAIEPAFPNLTASAIAPSALPLAAGTQHLLTIEDNLPAGFDDGHTYSWVIALDPENAIDELLETDNLTEISNTWTMTATGTRRAAPLPILSSQVNPGGETIHRTVRSARPFAGPNPDAFKGRARAKAEPIRYLRPEICIDHHD